MFPFTTTKYESVKYDACNMVMDGAAESEKLRGGGQNALQIGAEISITLSFKESFRVTHSPLFRGAAPLPADPPDDVDPTHSLSSLSGASVTEMLSAFVFSRRTAKRVRDRRENCHRHRHVFFPPWVRKEMKKRDL